MTLVVVCAATTDALPAAVLAATGTTPQVGTSARLLTPQTTFVLGTIYSYPSYGGRSLDLVGVGGPCPANIYSFASLASLGWDNDIDSFRSYSSCRTTLYENANYGGSHYGPYVNKTSIGIMANNASSVVYN
jgi:hypothetical protein